MRHWPVAHVSRRDYRGANMELFLSVKRRAFHAAITLVPALAACEATCPVGFTKDGEYCHRTADGGAEADEFTGTMRSDAKRGGAASDADGSMSMSDTGVGGKRASSG